MYILQIKKIDIYKIWGLLYLLFIKIVYNDLNESQKAFYNIYIMSQTFHAPIRVCYSRKAYK